MAGFTMTIILKGQAVADRLAGKLTDMSPFFEAVRNWWVRHNKDKFEEARGKETTGVDFGGGVRWDPLTMRYHLRKEREGMQDWLMVADGTLMRSLTAKNSQGWWEEIGPRAAEFGSLLLTGVWNFEKRPTQFLDLRDQRTTRTLAGAYLNNEPPFRRWQPSDVQRMDAEFQAMFAGVTL